MHKVNGRVDPLLYQHVNRFGCAGGPLVLDLTEAGRLRAFQVANGLKLEWREYEMLSAVVACGAMGWKVDGAPVVFLAARRLIQASDGRYIATPAGEAAMDAAYLEESRLLLRVAAESTPSPAPGPSDALHAFPRLPTAG